MNEEVFAKIDELNEKYVGVWKDVCNIESPSLDKAAVDRVGQYFTALAKERGWKTETFNQERFGNVVCVTMNAHVTQAPVALSGHMDTVHPIGSFGTPAVRLDGDTIYGPGVMDCKGGAVAGFLAMEALDRCGYRERPVMMLLQSNEEIGSGLDNKAPIEYICERAKDAVAFLNLEGHEGFFKGKAGLIRKGIAVFRFDVTGIATHASHCAFEGANAIAEAAHKIIEIEKIKERDGVTCSCDVISGGTATNTVAAECSFRVDVRFNNRKELEDVTARLREIARRTFVDGCSCEMVQTNLRPAMEFTDKNAALLDKANGLFEKSGLSRLEVGKRTGGSDAANVTEYGIPCIDSIGVEGERAHSTEERATVSSLSESAKRIAAIVSGL